MKIKSIVKNQWRRDLFISDGEYSYTIRDVDLGLADLLVKMNDRIEQLGKEEGE